MLNLNKCTKTRPKPKPTFIFDCSYVTLTLVCVCVSLCTTVVHNTAQISSDKFPSYPPENHHISDDVYWRGVYLEKLTLSVSKAGISYLKFLFLTTQLLLYLLVL